VKAKLCGVARRPSDGNIAKNKTIPLRFLNAAAILAAIATRAPPKRCPMFELSHRQKQRRRLRPLVALLALLGLLSGCIIVPAYGPPPRYYHYWR
jgi:hypothetical protein